MKKEQIQKFQQRLLEDKEKLQRLLNRNREAEQEMRALDQREEFDRASVSHSRELVCELGDAGFKQLKAINDALTRCEIGNYGECLRCGEEIHEKRLKAEPSATLCIQCQEGAEKEHAEHRPVMVGALKLEEVEEGEI